MILIRIRYQGDAHKIKITRKYLNLIESIFDICYTEFIKLVRRERYVIFSSYVWLRGICI